MVEQDLKTLIFSSVIELEFPTSHPVLLNKNELFQFRKSISLKSDLISQKTPVNSFVHRHSKAFLCLSDLVNQKYDKRQ